MRLHRHFEMKKVNEHNFPLKKHVKSSAENGTGFTYMKRRV